MFILSLKSSYKKYFPKENPDLIKAIIQESNLLIGERVLKGEDFLMPENLGAIFIAKHKNQLVYDYIHFCKTGEKIKQYNIKTFGYLYRVMWFQGYKNKQSLNNNVYKFRASRQRITRPLAKILQSGQDYYKDEEYVKRFHNGNKTRV